MADQTPSKPAQLNPLEHLDKVTEKLMAYSGKPGYNPHIYIEKVIKPLKAKLKANPKDEAAVKDALATSSDESNARIAGLPTEAELIEKQRSQAKMAVIATVPKA